jgi:hypothetical protein
MSGGMEGKSQGQEKINSFSFCLEAGKYKCGRGATGVLCCRWREPSSHREVGVSQVRCEQGTEGSRSWSSFILFLLRWFWEGEGPAIARGADGGEPHQRTWLLQGVTNMIASDCHPRPGSTDCPSSMALVVIPEENSNPVVKLLICKCLREKAVLVRVYPRVTSF